MAIMEDFAGGVSAMGGSLFLPVQNQMMEEDRNQRQQFNADQAMWDRQWQTEMSNTSYQRQVTDMQKAGINPMLLINKAGGASTPPGAVASTGGTAGYPSTGAPMPFFQNMVSAAQVALNQATIDKTKAEADEIRARTPTYEANIGLTQAQTNQARAAAEKLLQDAKTGVATATNLEQQTKNLQAQIPVFDETIKNLRALTMLHGEQANAAFKQAGLTEAEGLLALQKLKQDLPAAERALLDLKAQHSTLGLPEAQATSQAFQNKGGKVDALLAFLRALPIPFANAVQPRNY